MKEYVSERGVRGSGLEWARRECMNREGENLSSVATPFWDTSGGSKVSELLIDLIVVSELKNANRWMD